MAGESLLRRVAEAFEQGDLRPLFNAIDENIVWKSGFTQKAKARGGVYLRRAGVIEATTYLAAAYLFREFRPKEILSFDEIVWGLFDVAGDYLPRGQGEVAPATFRIECAIRWLVREDKIVEHQSFFDTDALLRQRINDFPL